jgi:hypothetical protein
MHELEVRRRRLNKEESRNEMFLSWQLFAPIGGRGKFEY